MPNYELIEFITMHEKFALYPLLTEGESLGDKNLLIQTLQSIHLIHWVMDAYKATSSSGAKMAEDHKLMLRFLLHSIGTAQQALSKEFTKSHRDIEELSFAQKQGHSTTCWWTHNRVVFAHRTTISECTVDMLDAEQGDIELVYKLEQSIYKLLPPAYKVNHFKDLPYTPAVFPAITDDGVSNFNNIYNTITVTESLQTHRNYANSLSHQICVMACIEMASKNLVLLNSAKHIPDINIDLVTDTRNNIIAHSFCVGDMLEEMDSINAALSWLSAHKTYFESKIIKSQLKVQEVEEMPSSSARTVVTTSTHTVPISNVVNIKPVYSEKRRSVHRGESNKIPTAAIELLKFLVPWQPIKNGDNDILSFTEHHVMSALLMEVENLYKIPLENRDYSRFDQIVLAFGPLVSQAHEFEVYFSANATPPLWQVCGKKQVITALPSNYNTGVASSGGVIYTLSFNTLVYCTGDFELVKRIAALGFTPTTDLSKQIAVLSFLRKTDTPASAEHKLEEFAALYKYYWGNFSILDLAASIVINLHPDVSLKYLGRQFHQAVNKFHTEGKQQMTVLQISLKRYAATLLYPSCMLQLIPALLQQDKKADLEKLILGPDKSGSMGLFHAISSVYIRTAEAINKKVCNRNIAATISSTNLLSSPTPMANTGIQLPISVETLKNSIQQTDVQTIHKKTGKVCDNYIFFAAMHAVLLEQDKYPCTMEFFADPKGYLATMFEQAKNDDYSKAIPFLREKIVPPQHIKQMFLDDVQQSSVAGYIELIKARLLPDKWCLTLADFAWHYQLCLEEQICRLRKSTKKHVITTECKQAIAGGAGKYKLYLLVINNEKHQLGEYLRGISKPEDFPTVFTISEDNKSIVPSANVFALAKEFADDNVYNSLKDKWKQLLQAKVQELQVT